MTRCPRRFPLAFASSLLLIALPAVAQPGISGFEPIGKFILEVEGEEAPAARLFQSTSPPAILVDSSRLPAPVLINVQDRTVQTLQLLKLAPRQDGRLDLLPDAAVAAQPPFQVDGVADGVTVRFSVDGVSALLRPKPDLVGLREAADLSRHSPEYAQRAVAYRPSEPMLDRLRQQSRSVRVRVFFGTWCPACGEMVPRIMRVEDELAGSNVEIEYYGLPRGFDGEPEASRYDVTSVPTAIVFVDGKEVGRIQGNSWRLPELTLNNLLAGS